MSRFIQLHLLTSYPPANPNRDDLGRPKTATMGGANRLRISSQSLKRAWRTSDVFEGALKGHIGTRTKEYGKKIQARLIEKGLTEKQAMEYAIKIAEVFGKLKTADDEKLDHETLVFISPEEQKAVMALADKLAEERRPPVDADLKLLRKNHTAVDIALFGRMLASAPEFNTEAAAQVSHAITVHKVAVEDDFFTAVDDLKTSEEDMGAGHMGNTEFAAGLFYLYVCVNREQLKAQLGGDDVLTGKAMEALTEAVATVTPSGKRNSFGNHARASYILAEKGSQQPRSLSVSFLEALKSEDLLTEAIKKLTATRENMDKTYGPCADSHHVMNAHTGEGSLKAVCQFVKE